MSTAAAYSTEGALIVALHESEEALQELRPPGLNFLPILMMYTLSR